MMELRLLMLVISWLLAGLGVAFWYWWESDKEREKPGDLLLFVVCGWISVAVLVVESVKEASWWRRLWQWQMLTRRGLQKKRKP